MITNKKWIVTFSDMKTKGNVVGGHLWTEIGHQEKIMFSS